MAKIDEGGPVVQPKWDIPNEPPINSDPKGPPTAKPTVDWKAYLHLTGMPPDVIARIEAIFRDTDDPQQATILAMAYIRGTDWYRVTFPGIGEGIAKGLFADETGYRNYISNINVLYTQFYGRSASTLEIGNYITAGYDPGYVGKLFEGDAFVKANKDDIEYLAGAFGEGALDSEALGAYGKQRVGLGNVLGANVERVLAHAQTVLEGMFGGGAASGSTSLGPSGLAQSSLSRKPGSPDLSV